MSNNFLIIIFITLFLNSCGYTPMYSKKLDKNLNIELLSFEGDREINNAIKYNFKRYSNRKDGLKVLVKTNSNYTKNTGTKNLAGDTQSYNISASVTFTISYDEDEKIFTFTENSKINNLDSQLDETTYEKNIKKNFGILFSDKLILQLTKLK